MREEAAHASAIMRKVKAALEAEPHRLVLDRPSKKPLPEGGWLGERLSAGWWAVRTDVMERAAKEMNLTSKQFTAAKEYLVRTGRLKRQHSGKGKPGSTLSNRYCINGWKFQANKLRLQPNPRKKTRRAFMPDSTETVNAKLSLRNMFKDMLDYVPRNGWIDIVTRYVGSEVAHLPLEQIVDKILENHNVSAPPRLRAHQNDTPRSNVIPITKEVENPTRPDFRNFMYWLDKGIAEGGFLHKSAFEVFDNGLVYINKPLLVKRYAAYLQSVRAASANVTDCRAMLKDTAFREDGAFRDVFEAFDGRAFVGGDGPSQDTISALRLHVAEEKGLCVEELKKIFEGGGLRSPTPIKQDPRNRLKQEDGKKSKKPKPKPKSVVQKSAEDATSDEVVP